MSQSFRVIKSSYRGISIILLSLTCAMVFAQEQKKVASDDLFALVNGEPIRLQNYVQALRNAARNRFYHGKAPEAEVNRFKYEAGQELINTTLLLQEANRRHIQADKVWVEGRYARLIEKYKKHPKWEEDKEVLMTDLKDRLNKQSQLSSLEKEIKNIARPTQEQLETYYEKHPDKFTSPGRFRVSTILLKVEPWAQAEAWEAAKTEASRIAKEIREGAEFAEMAALYSQDSSADEGGDLGYLHRGMLGETSEAVLEALQPGQVSEVTQLLEGFALFKLVAREPSVLNKLSDVKDRAEELWLRQERESAYKQTLQALRVQADMEIKDPIYLNLQAQETELAQTEINAQK